jgi:hypothetical protein
MKKIKLWLLDTPVKFKTWLGTKQESLSTETSEELPLDFVKSVKRAIADLPAPPTHQKAVQAAFVEAITRWRENPDAPNSLVILGSPLDEMSRLFRDTLEAWENEKGLRVRSVKSQMCPHDYAEIKTNFEVELGVGEGFSPDNPELEARQETIVIPRLDWCFLRCIGGLEAIELLRDTIYKDASRFWLIGCNQLAWTYLDYVVQVSAYFQQTQLLPQLNGSQLQEWLQPARRELKLYFNGSLDELDEEEQAKLQEQYFDRLANISQGITSVAANLWLRSLYSESPETDASDSPDADSNSTVQPIGQGKANLPDLPVLLPEDRYLLYSLLLHGGMSLSHLALSLGETESNVQARVHFLWLNDAIERDRNFLWVEPAHYPRISSLLAQNNFLV